MIICIMDLEEFIDIQGYEGLYKINRKGEILGLKKNKLLKQHTHRLGYLIFFLFKNKKRKQFYIHRLIAIHFIPNPENLPEIDHKDRNRANNNIENLRWSTRSDNQKNKEIKGSITEEIDKRKKTKNIYYRVKVRGKHLKRFKIREEAEEFLKKYLEENEN